jgi:tRNA threonylcarbamoyladenosine biosynthesis protein TsaE
VVNSEAETEAFASGLAAQLAAGGVILLSGDLGAGKTVFVRGLAKGLGVNPDDVTSPTFTLVHEYRGRVPLIHVDLYRLDRADLDEIGLDSELAATGVTAIEWPERLIRETPGAIRVRIEDKGETTREISVSQT